MKGLPVLACALLACRAVSAPDESEASRDALFVGNSHTYYHDLPQTVEWMARQVGDSSLRVIAIAEGGFSLDDHLLMGWAADELRRRPWRWVVLQQGPSSLPENQGQLARAAQAFAPLIRAAGAEPVLFQPWPSVARRADAAASLTSYWNAAVAAGAILAPAGDAFTAALAQVPAPDVYHPDGLHASPLGAYLAAAVIHARLTGVAPEALPPRIPYLDVDSGTVRALQRAAAVALARSPARPRERRVVDDTLAASRPYLVVPDTTFFAEGIDVDPRDGSVFLASIHHRNVFRVHPGAAPVALLQDAEPPIGAALGVRFDAARNLLWITTAPLPMMRDAGRAGDVGAELVAVDAARGTITQRYVLGDGRGVPGELALTPDGQVLVSDGVRGVLYRLRPAAARVEVVQSAALKSPQGIAVDPSGTVAWVADWSRGLLRWDLQTDRVAPVAAADGSTPRGIDGLVRAPDGSLVGVQNGATPPRIVRIALSADGRLIREMQVLDAATAYEGEPTVGVIAGDRLLFVASSAWPFWDADGARIARERPLPPVVIRALSLGAP